MGRTYQRPLKTGIDGDNNGDVRTTTTPSTYNDNHHNDHKNCHVGDNEDLVINRSTVRPKSVGLAWCKQRSTIVLVDRQDPISHPLGFDRLPVGARSISFWRSDKATQLSTSPPALTTCGLQRDSCSVRPLLPSVVSRTVDSSVCRSTVEGNSFPHG